MKVPLPAVKWLRGALRVLGLTALGILLLLVTLWATAALYFDVRIPWLRVPLAVLYVLGLLAAWVLVKRRWLAASLTAGGFALVLAWWFTLQPSNERDWQADVAVLPYADINGNQITLHRIRNCDYRTETDFDVRYYDKAFDLDKLRTADLYMVYWGSPNMAHTMVSFGFEGGDYVCFSIETRRQKGQGYSAIKGLFRQFELIYIVGDELLYQRGAITTNLPLAVLKQRCHINDPARAVDREADFSRQIRQGVPGTGL